ncbi:hypothetical protein JIN85_16865 [Luteolibacter pohnpeiensis]|uniref:Uncharacterized protein n=2 Tax=Luteolibacter pohnpeiensis TaxID=454153 RepID=A0A934SDX4_9BACT|nr:hypothetical protein [Luteolibacter pohnpeiensis]
MIFTPPFSVSGESGFALANQRLTFELAQIEDAVLTLQSVGVGTLAFTQPADGSAPVPDTNQKVHCFDATGRRIFTGTAKRRLRWQRGEAAVWQVTISDAWQDYELIDLVGSVTDADGVKSVRPLVKYESGDLSESIRDLLARLQALGAGLQPGEIAETFNVLPMTFAKYTGASALAEMMQWIPDAMTQVDYSGTGLPRLNVRRRSQAEVVKVELGTDLDDTLEILLEDLPDDRPAKVEVQSATRNDKQEIVFVTQVAGDKDAAAKATQNLVASGPENNDVLPTDVYENFVIQTGAAGFSQVAISDNNVAGAVAATSYFAMTPVPASTSYTVWSTPSSGATGTVYTPAPYKFSRPDGTAFGYPVFPLLSESIPDWLVSDYDLLIEDALISGTFYETKDGTTADPSAMVAYLKDQGLIYLLQGYSDNTSGAPYRKYWFYTAVAQFKVINLEYAVAQTLYRKQDFDFIFPPADLADNLFAAQNFLPFKGSASFGPRAPLVPIPGQVLSVLNSPNALWPTARALVESTEIDLVRLSAEVTLGVPSRTAASTLIDRFRSASRDNIAT